MYHLIPTNTHRKNTGTITETAAVTNNMRLEICKNANVARIGGISGSILDHVFGRYKTKISI